MLRAARVLAEEEPRKRDSSPVGLPPWLQAVFSECCSMRWIGFLGRGRRGMAVGGTAGISYFGLTKFHPGAVPRAIIPTDTP